MYTQPLPIIVKSFIDIEILSGKPKQFGASALSSIVPSVMSNIIDPI
jgi:hypothetical protein